MDIRNWYTGEWVPIDVPHWALDGEIIEWICRTWDEVFELDCRISWAAAAGRMPAGMPNEFSPVE